MKSPKHLEAYKAARPYIKLTGNYLIVERVEVGEIKTASGLIASIDPGNQMNTISASMPLMVHVLAVGEGYLGEDGSEAELDTKPGDILMVGKNSVKWFPTLPLNGYSADSVGITSEAETQIRWSGVDGYERYHRALSGTFEKEVE